MNRYGGIFGCTPCVLLLAIWAAPASADPYTRAAGEGRIIANAILTNASKAFDDQGDALDIADYKQQHLYITGEYGVTDDLTVVLAPSLQHVKQTGGQSFSGLGYTDVGAKYRIAHGDDWTSSLQLLARIPGEKSADPIAQISQTGMEYDAKAGVGYSFGPGKKTFATGEVGYRFRSGDPPNEMHADFTLGSNVTDRLMLLAASYNTISDGKGRGIFNRRHRYHDIYVSGVYAINDNLSVQAGMTATVAGRNALRQSGPLVGLWYKF